MKTQLTFLLFILLQPLFLIAQPAEESVEKPSRWHFAVNAGTHYLWSHYDGFYYNKFNNGRKDDRDVEFRKNFGLWFGGNVNYRVNKNWYLSSEAAFRSLKSGYKATREWQGQLTFGEDNMKAFQIVIKPISVTREFMIGEHWKVPLNLGVHFSYNLYHEHQYKQKQPPALTEKSWTNAYRTWHLDGFGLALESGITKIMDKGELSLLVIPTPRLWYYTEEFPYYYYVHVATSGAIVKVQYAFK